MLTIQKIDGELYTGTAGRWKRDETRR